MLIIANEIQRAINQLPCKTELSYIRRFHTNTFVGVCNLIQHKQANARNK